MGSFCKVFGALACVLVPCAVLAQEPPAAGGGQEGGGRGGRAAEPEIRPYDRVVTKEARSDDGVFTVHRIKDRIYYEIPKDRLGREFLWVSQIYATAPIDAYRRNLQRAYVETLGNRVNGAQAQSDDARAFFRGELKTLDGDLAAAAARQTDRATLLHIADVRTQIARALDPTVQATAAGARTGTDLADESLFDVTSATDVCWPDYAVLPKTKR